MAKTLIYNDCITFDNETILWDNEDITFDQVCFQYVDRVVYLLVNKSQSVNLELKNETYTVNLEFNKSQSVNLTLE